MTKSVFALLALLLTSSVAHAEVEAESDGWDPGERVASRVKGEPRFSDRMRSGDGVYDRFDGDLFLSLGAGVEWSHGVRPAIEARALYYYSVGLVIGYSDAFDRDAFVRRTGWAGLDLRPLFLPRWALDKEFQLSFWDLTLDSVSLGAAAFLAEPRRGDTKFSVEFSAGFGLPLFARARGLWLEGRGFWRPSYEDASTGLLVSLAYYAPVLTPFVK
ncbi:MAG TPA: hypothetical protein VFQ35_06455 [Polyangiaceae bacterium]|nr:hypothetical protein [Polyangiaceae bacterium]